MPHCQILPDDLPSMETPAKYSRGRVLVVEDNEVTAMVLSGNLTSKGCDVDLVKDGEEAVQKLRKTRYDLVLMDVRLPDMHGVEAVRAIRHLPFPACMTPVVAMTATVVRDCEVLCRSVGINDIICKPISDMTMAESLDRWLVGAASDKGGYLSGSVASEQVEEVAPVPVEEVFEPVVENVKLAIR